MDKLPEITDVELDGLRIQHKLFAYHWAMTDNKRGSAIKAGYARTSAGRSAHELSKKPEIIALRDYFRGEMSRELRIDADELIRIAEQAATLNLKDFVYQSGPRRGEYKNILDLTDEQAKLVEFPEQIITVAKDGTKTVRQKYRHDRRQHLENLYKIKGLMEGDTTGDKMYYFFANIQHLSAAELEKYFAQGGSLEDVFARELQSAPAAKGTDKGDTERLPG
jgi:phage terminase small subunit